jgi:hypothetical protein
MLGLTLKLIRYHTTICGTHLGAGLYRLVA